ncbi:ester cyclase [Burkholderia anthina]|uniref:ester cyclase n=1 Tax=Burkholderia anthina TaxID=179879 RepID=UPI00158E98E5|nr:nuclear transport factor 2 family protein [Burkholderia anthina]
MRSPDQLILDYIDCWQRQDTAGLVALFAPDGQYTDPTLLNMPIERDKLASHAQAFFDAVPDLNFEIIQHGAAGADSAALRWVMRGKQTGPLGPLPPKGGRLAIPGCDFLRARDGLIVDVVVMFDQKLFLEQAGYVVEIRP